MSFCRKQNKRTFNIAILQEYRKNQKNLFQQKYPLSASKKLSYGCKYATERGVFLLKGAIYDERCSFCRKTERISYRKVFLPNFCQKFWQKERQKALSFDLQFPHFVSYRLSLVAQIECTFCEKIKIE